MRSRGCYARPLVSTSLDGQVARDRVRDRVPDADPEDLVLFDDLLGIADPNAALPSNRSGCSSAAVDRLGECRVVGPRNPGGLCR